MSPFTSDKYALLSTLRGVTPAVAEALQNISWTHLAMPSDFLMDEHPGLRGNERAAMAVSVAAQHVLRFHVRYPQGGAHRLDKYKLMLERLFYKTTTRWLLPWEWFGFLSGVDDFSLMFPLNQAQSLLLTMIADVITGNRQEQGPGRVTAWQVAVHNITAMTKAAMGETGPMYSQTAQMGILLIIQHFGRIQDKPKVAAVFKTILDGLNSSSIDRVTHQLLLEMLRLILDYYI